MKEETTLSVEELAKENESLKRELINYQTKVRSLELRGLQVHQENEMIKASPRIAEMKAEMDYQLAMAGQFIKSGAFKCDNPEQAYTIIKAGQEMGLTPVQSMNALYIVNGSINPYGKHMVGQLTKEGYRLQYLEETPNQVRVRIYRDQDGFDESELVTDRDQILQRSKAMGFSKKNKMRYHGIRMIINFHLAHHFGSVSDMMNEEFNAVAGQISAPGGRPNVQALNDQKENDRIMQHIADSDDLDMLSMVEDHLDTDEQKIAYNDKYYSLQNMIQDEQE